MSTQKVTDPVIEAVSSSVLTGALPVLDGSALTGVTGFVNTTNANDPATDTNPGTGVGTVWVNSTSGEIFICTDATTDANVWTNVGGGSDDVAPFTFQGLTHGYHAGGLLTGSNWTAVIDKFAFASNTTAASHGNLSEARQISMGSSSATDGFTAGGNNNSWSQQTSIDKWSFSSNTTSADHGDLRVANQGASGHSTGTHGYVSGNGAYPMATPIDKYAYSANTTSSGHGDLENIQYHASEHSSTTDGFIAGGISPSNGSNQLWISKFSFASNTTASSHGNLQSGKARHNPTGCTSTTHGYVCGGYISSDSAVIEKFQISSNTTASTVGDLTVARYDGAGSSSTTHGFVSGGNGHKNQIDKLDFSSDGNATDHGDLSAGKVGASGHQV
tara:strand:- start:6929 stop:8092 length:1164 start_codon:yes stop_codon:yes gene_type:complete